jgi:hypothetical protein
MVWPSIGHPQNHKDYPMTAINEAVAAMISYQVKGFALLNSQRENLVAKLGGIYSTLFAARTLLPLRLTTVVYDDKPVTVAQLEELFTKPSLGVAEGNSTDRTHRRHLERLASLHNAWVGRHGGFARANSADGVAVIEALLKAKPKAFCAEAELWLNAFGMLSVTMPESYVVAGSDDAGDFIRPVSSSDKLDVFLQKAGSKAKAAKRQSISVAKKGKAAKAAKVQAKSEAAVASAKADPAKVDEGVKQAGQSNGSTLPKAVVEANSTSVGHIEEPKVPGSALGWSDMMGTAKLSIDMLIGNSDMSLEQKTTALRALGSMVLTGLNALKSVADTMASAKPKASAQPPIVIAETEKAAKPPVVAAKPKRKAKAAKLATVETVVVDEKPSDSPADSAKADEAEARVIVKSAKPKAKRTKLRDVAAKLASNPAVTVKTGEGKLSRAERKAANKAAFAASRAALLAAKANGAATH